MNYARIDTTTGDVIEFPYRNNELTGNIQRGETLPDDVVEVDTYTNRPATAWDEVLRYADITRNGDAYILNYTIEARYFEDDADRKKKFLALHKTKDQNNEKRFAYLSGEMVKDYPLSERESWYVQVSEAERYLADNTSVVPMISIMSTNRGETVDVLAQKIVDKDNLMRVAFGDLLGRYQDNKNKLNSIDTEDDTTWSAIDTIGAL